MFSSKHSAIIAAAAILLTGCAQLPPVAERVAGTSTPQLSIGGVVADRGAASGDWLDSRVSVAGPFDILSYQAGYAIQGGDLLPQLTDAPDTAPLLAAPKFVGGGAFTQSLAAVLPSVGGGRPSLSFNSLSGDTLTSAGDTLRNQQQKALLSWSPSPLALQLQWSTPRSIADPLQPLDCSLGGKLQLGLGVLGADEQSLQLGARSCNVDAPERVAGSLGVDSWSGAWQFGRSDAPGRLSLTMLEALPSAAQRNTDSAATGYELQVSQARSQGRWTGDTAVGVRRVAEIGGSDAHYWVAQANLRREISSVAVTAGWQRDADPLWFAPGVASPVDQIALGLDLRSWLQQRLGVSDLVNASLSYRWNESADPALSGGAVFWNLAKTW
jgi:hypothetical protein